MTCHCTCHEMAFYSSTAVTVPPCCFKCAVTPTPTLQVHHLQMLNVQLELVNDDATFTTQLRAVMTQPGPMTLNTMQYGVVVGISQQPMAANYMLSMEYAHEQVVREFQRFFDKEGWPTWLMALVMDNPEPHQGPGVYIETNTHGWQPWQPVMKTASGSGYVDGRKVVDDLGFLLPGLKEITRCPAVAAWCQGCLGKPMPIHAHVVKDCGHPDKMRCNVSNSVQKMIVHLNDSHGWERETQIADWLESLDIDLTFPSEEEIVQRKEERQRQHAEAAFEGGDTTAAINKIIQDIYAPVIAKMTEATSTLMASWHQKVSLTSKWEKKVVTFTVENKLAALKEIAEKMTPSGGDPLYLEHMALVVADQLADWAPPPKKAVLVHPTFYNDLAKWIDPKNMPYVELVPYALDKVTHTVDPLEHKKKQGQSYSKFVNNPTKSHPKKKKG